MRAYCRICVTYADQAKRLILDSALPKDFAGINESWVEAFFNGY